MVLRRKTLSSDLERCFSGVFTTLSLPDRYAVKIISPIITNIVLIFLNKFSIILEYFNSKNKK